MVILIGIFVPYAGAAMAAISPVPLLLLVLRHGWRVSIEALVAAALLLTFLTGPFTVFALLAVALRGFALGIGLRRGWGAHRTVLGGTTFLWIVVCAGVSAAAAVMPGWQTATEQGMRLTYHELTGLVGVVLRLFGLGQPWHELGPRLADFLTWFMQRWLLLLPLVVWPILLVAVGAEYVIAEVILPRFGFHPPPLRLPGIGRSVDRRTAWKHGLRFRLAQKLEASVAEREAGRPRHGRRLTPAPAPVNPRARVEPSIRETNRPGPHNDGPPDTRS